MAYSEMPHTKHIIRQISVVIIFILSFVASISCAENVKKTKESISLDYYINDEIKISNDINCQYTNEYEKKIYEEFQYPIIFLDNNSAVNLYLDRDQNKIIRVEIENNLITEKNQIEIPFISKIKPWPYVFIQEGNVNFAFLEVNDEYTIYDFLFYELKKSNLKFTSRLSFNRQQKSVNKYCNFLDIFPYKDNKKYLVVGSYSERSFHLGMLFSGYSPVFTKNFSLTSDENNKILQVQKIDQEEGKFSTKYMRYSTNHNVAHTSWVRDFKKHKEAIYYSNKAEFQNWVEPILVYEKEKKLDRPILGQLSLHSSNDKAFLTWVVRDEGVFYAEISRNSDGYDVTTEKINDLNEKEPAQLSQAFNDRIPTSKLKIKNNTIYFINVENSADQHKLTLRVKRKSIWSPEYTISEGRGDLVAPEFVVDPSGNLHLVYLKEELANNYSCYYRNIENKSTPLPN